MLRRAAPSPLTARVRATARGAHGVRAVARPVPPPPRSVPGLSCDRPSGKAEAAHPAALGELWSGQHEDGTVTGTAAPRGLLCVPPVRSPLPGASCVSLVSGLLYKD